jgi:hypothetical protein
LDGLPLNEIAPPGKPGGAECVSLLLQRLLNVYSISGFCQHEYAKSWREDQGIAQKNLELTIDW